MPEEIDPANPEPNPNTTLEFVTLPVEAAPPPKKDASVMTRYDRLALWSSLALGLVALGVSIGSYAEARRASGMVFASGRPLIQITAARMRLPPKPGGRATAELRFENVGGRDAADLKIWLQVTGRPTEAMRRTGVPVVQKIEASIPPSGAGWVTVYSYNFWEDADALKDLAIGGVLTYSDAANLSGSFRQSFCFAGDTRVDLLTCNAVPALNAWRLFLEKE